MTVHVLGHVLDTPALALADYRARPGAQPVSGARLRRLATGATLITGIVLAIVVINSGWMKHVDSRRRTLTWRSKAFVFFDPDGGDHQPDVQRTASRNLTSYTAAR